MGRPLLPHTPPHLHPVEALSRHQGGGRCAGLPGFSALNYPPRARPPRALFPPQPVVPLAPTPPPRAGRREWAGVIPPGLVSATWAKRSPSWLPGSPTRPHYESQRAAPPRASAAEAVPAGSWSLQRPRRSLTPNRPRVPAARSEAHPSPPPATVPAPDLGRASNRGPGSGGALGLRGLSIPSP